MTFDDDYDVMLEDGPCPKCGEHELRSRDCDQIGCEDGYYDEHDDDPINFAPGELYRMCDECYGTGVLRWCSKCGFDLTRDEYMKARGKT